MSLLLACFSRRNRFLCRMDISFPSRTLADRRVSALPAWILRRFIVACLIGVWIWASWGGIFGFPARTLGVPGDFSSSVRLGIRICVWCWHHIIDMAEKDDTEGRCPACRTPYDKERIVGMAANCERVVAEVNAEKKQKTMKAKPKTSVEARKHLNSVRACNNPDCLYLHDVGCQEDSFTKDEIISAYTRGLCRCLMENWVAVALADVMSAISPEVDGHRKYRVWVILDRQVAALRHREGMSIFKSAVSTSAFGGNSCEIML
ncbi:hypothetical protein Taro_035368 [Colocasia esculenta]|uniref:Uncharacterized protein n=1 Tax=Colocasia esculenta TaxID=4460 RepID=A0A843WAC2_COLES|nr:hypothetical protein [Colocasia esculenta]